MAEQDVLLANQDEQINGLFDDLTETQAQTIELQHKISELENEIFGKLDQLDAIKNMNTELNKLAQQGNVLKSEIEAARQIGGRGVIINLGNDLGWAIYQALYGESPYIIRNGNQIYAKGGLILIHNDDVFHSDGENAVWLIPPGAKVTLPH